MTKINVTMTKINITMTKPPSKPRLHFRRKYGGNIGIFSENTG
jgi:hypothetical protein